MKNVMKNRYKGYLKRLDSSIEALEKLPLHKIDENRFLLKIAFNIAYENKLFELYSYEKNIQDELKFKLFSKITKYSGSLTFLAIQILAANAIMAKNSFKRKEYFFNKKCGIAINHLRAKNKTFVSGTKCTGGYTLNGVLTWASGYKIFDHLLIGFHFEGKELEVLTKFEECEGFEIIDTPEVFIGQSLNTVNVKLKNFFVEEQNIVSSNEIGNYTKNKSLSKTVHYAIYGLALGSLKSIKDEDFKKSTKKKFKKIEKKFLESTDSCELDNIRIELFNLVQKVITISMILNGGKSILLEKRLQRYYRELIIFNSNGLNDQIKKLFLDDFII